MGLAKISIYDKFSLYYDDIYSFIDRGADCNYITEVFSRYSKKKVKSVLDIGCGTGDHALLLVREGYAVTGIDMAENQVKAAINKASNLKFAVKPEFLRADMRNFSLDRKYDVAISMFGAINYALNDDDLEKVLASINKHLDSEGLFIFEFWNTGGLRPDVSTGGYKTWLTISTENYDLIRLDKSVFNAEKGYLTIDFDFIVYKGDKILDTFKETHKMRVFSLGEIRSWLKRTGFEVIGLFEPLTFDLPKSNSFRVTAVARKTAIT